MEADNATESAMAGDARLISPVFPPSSDIGVDSATTNPRKRKKASRACDYCHLNHQPCDNGKPRCAVCEKHNKPCNYLRPSKRRGPQKGYRTALNTYKESAAAWGVVLGAIPGLDALIEGHLRSDAGKALLQSVKDPPQQDALIQRWQQSTVFKAFFPPGGEDSASIEDADADPESSQGLCAMPDGPTLPSKTPASPVSRSPFSPPCAESGRSPTAVPQQPTAAREPTSLSDILAKDAARSSSRALQTLAPLGFAPNETIADFYDMGANPEQVSQPDDPNSDLGTDAEQRVYYELLMGRSFSSAPPGR